MGPDLTTTPAFCEICERFRALEARKSEDEAIANFEQAKLIQDARVRLKVPVSTICEALALSAQSVHAYRSVAARIEAPLFRELMKERRPDGLPLFSWSIVAQVARLADAREREDLLERIRNCGWRTRAVEEHISSRRGGLDQPRRRGRTPRHATPAVLAVAADALARLAAEVAHACEIAAPEELAAARAALARCVAAASRAQSLLEERVADDGARSRDGREEREPSVEPTGEHTWLGTRPIGERAGLATAG